MFNGVHRILLVEDNPGDERLVRESLAETDRAEIEVESAGTIAEAKALLSAREFDAVLLDLQLPDSTGLDSFINLREHSPEVPVVVLTALTDERIGLRAVERGAQEFLIKGQVTPRLLSRSIRYAIQRHRLQEDLRNLTLIDDLTGLYNRRGFSTLARQQWKLAQRTKAGLLLVFADIDGLKQINDLHGHAEGDSALIEVAALLKGCFRDSDIAARLSGDEFTVLAVDAEENHRIEARIHERLNALNAQAGKAYSISLSLGLARLDPAHPFSLSAWMAKADESLYATKRAKVKP